MSRLAPYKWKILEDHIATPGAQPGTTSNAVGLIGPGNATAEDIELPDRFRMYDGDGELYYEGVTNALSCRKPDVTGFEPLDDFGEPNAGCCEIRYYNRELCVWEEL